MGSYLRDLSWPISQLFIRSIKIGIVETAWECQQTRHSYSRNKVAVLNIYSNQKPQTKSKKLNTSWEHHQIGHWPKQQPSKKTTHMIQLTQSSTRYQMNNSNSNSKFKANPVKCLIQSHNRKFKSRTSRHRWMRWSSWHPVSSTIRFSSFQLHFCLKHPLTTWYTSGSGHGLEFFVRSVLDCLDCLWWSIVVVSTIPDAVVMFASMIGDMNHALTLQSDTPSQPES